MTTTSSFILSTLSRSIASGSSFFTSIGSSKSLSKSMTRISLLMAFSLFQIFFSSSCSSLDFVIEFGFIIFPCFHFIITLIKYKESQNRKTPRQSYRLTQREKNKQKKRKAAARERVGVLVIQFSSQNINSQALVMELNSTCPHCKTTYSEGNPPKTLVNCNHNLCLNCLKELILCPVDRVRIQLRRFTLEAFKTNQALLQVCTASPLSQKSQSKSLKSGKKSTPNSSHPQKSLKSKSSKKAEPSIQKEENIVVTDFMQEKVQEEENFLPQESNITEKSYKSPLLDKKRSLSPKKQTINYEMCLLHSKKADLICIQDKCAICSGCGLFGEHKHHTIIPYDTFLNQYSALAEECFKNYEQLQSRSDKMNPELLQEKITEMLSDKKGKELKTIKMFIKQLNDLVKTVEKQLINNLELTVSFKKQKIMKFLTFQELSAKRDHYMLGVQSMTEGLQCLFNLENIEKYITFIDSNHERSYIQEEGEYLIRQIDNYSKTLNQRIEEEVAEFSMGFKTPQIDMFKSLFSIESRDSKGLYEMIELNKRETQNANKPYTPSRSRLCKDTTVILGKQVPKKESPIKQQPEDNLLLQLNSKSVSPQKKGKNLSPIHPLTSFQNFQINCQSSMEPEFFLKVSAEPPLPDNRRMSKTNASKPFPPRMSKTKLNENMENYLGESSRLRSKPKSSNNSNHLTERELLNVLNEKSDNKKRKKLDLPEKYAKIYDDLQRERLEVVDFGGAFLGDSAILTISECFQQSRGRIKQVKLMNNKLTDESFPELVSRCRLVPSLNLSYNSFSERCLEWLLLQAEHLGDLRNITLSNCKIVLRSNRDKIEELKRRGINVSL